jgi:hypothetical protein
MRTTIILCLLIFFLSFSSLSQTKIEIVSLGNFNKEEKDKVERIISNTEKIINSQDFMTQILNHKVNGELRFENNKNESNADIYKKIMSGYELLEPIADNKWQLNLNLKWFFGRSTLAYTYFNKPEIYINSRYYKNGYEAEIAGTICHEYMHKIGYSHDQRSTSIRPYSVPYAVGGICELLYINNYGGFDLKAQECGLWCRLKRIMNGRFK